MRKLTTINPNAKQSKIYGIAFTFYGFLKTFHNMHQVHFDSLFDILFICIHTELSFLTYFWLLCNSSSLLRA